MVSTRFSALRRHMVQHTQRAIRQSDTGVNSLKTLLVLGLAVAVTELMHLCGLGNENLIIVYLLASVIITRISTSYVFSVLFSVVSVFLYDFLITTPRMGLSFTVGTPITLFIMLLVTLITSTMTMTIKEQAKQAEIRERRAELLYAINVKILSARDCESIISLALEYIVAHIHRSVIFYAQDPVQGAAPYFMQAGDDAALDAFVTPAQSHIAHMAYVGRQAQGPAAAKNGIHYLPVNIEDRQIGMIGVSCKTGPLDRDHISILNLLTTQVALALELQQVSDRQNATLVEAETEKMRSNLLRAVSHDLRTPLTGILGASTTILEQGAQMDTATRNVLLDNIQSDAKWLIRMVENLLAVTRIHGEGMAVTKSLEAAEEVIAESVSIVRAHYPHMHFRVSVPAVLLMVPMDAMLISQVLINLLENAAKNSPPGSPIMVTLDQREGCAHFEVLDQGSGIPAQVAPQLFTAPILGQGRTSDASRGTGIGLSICKSIIQAHGGSIEGRNRPQGGAVFRFWLPLESIGRRCGTAALAAPSGQEKENEPQ